MLILPLRMTEACTTLQSVYHGFGERLSHKRLGKAGDFGLRDAIVKVIEDSNFQVSDYLPGQDFQVAPADVHRDGQKEPICMVCAMMQSAPT